MRIRLICFIRVCAAATPALAACGGDDDSTSGAGAVSGDTLKIYSSLPFQGSSKDQSDAVVDGEKLALKQAGNKVGKYKIDYGG